MLARTLPEGGVPFHRKYEAAWEAFTMSELIGLTIFMWPSETIYCIEMYIVFIVCIYITLLHVFYVITLRPHD